MQCTVLRSGTSLVVSVKITTSTKNAIDDTESELYSLCDALNMQLKHVSFINQVYNSSYRSFDFVCFEKIDKRDTSSYSVRLSCPELEIDNIFEVDDSDWRMIRECSYTNYSYTISVRVESITQLNPFAKLYDDLNLTDFTLKCDDGSVDIHKAVLAAVSTYFMAEITKVNENEAPVTSMDIPDTSIKALNDFKRALYMDVLPENNLEGLLLLASFFKLKVLEYKCVDKMLNTLKPTEVGDLLGFALKHNNITMILGILEQVRTGDLKVSEIRKHYLSQ